MNLEKDESSWAAEVLLQVRDVFWMLQGATSCKTREYGQLGQGFNWQVRDSINIQVGNIPLTSSYCLDGNTFANIIGSLIVQGRVSDILG